MSKESACNAGDTGNVDLIPGWEWFPGGGNGNPFHYSCLENPMDRGDGRLQSMRLKESDKTDWLNITEKKRFLSVKNIFNWFVFNWRVITLQYCVGFCPTSTWISHHIHVCRDIFSWSPWFRSYSLIWKQSNMTHLKKKILTSLYICPHLITHFSTLVTSYCH